MTGQADVLIEQIASLCPQCNQPAKSSIIERNDRIFQIIACTEHGTTETEIFSDASLYKKLNAWNALLFNSHDSAQGAPDISEQARWSTSQHLPVLGIVDLTNQCNFHCPLCFADGDSEKSFYFLDMETIRTMLEKLLSQTPAPCRNIQFSGGNRRCTPNFLKFSKWLAIWVFLIFRQPQTEADSSTGIMFHCVRRWGSIPFICSLTD